MDIFNLANYSFNPHAIPYLVSGLFVLILGIVVFHRKASSLTHISFAVFALTIAMWLLGWFVSYHANNPSTAFFWTKILWIGVIFISPSIYFFAVSILDLPQKKKRIIFGYLLFLPFLFALPFDAVISGVWSYWWAYYAKAGILELPFLLVFFSQMLFIFWRYVQFLRNPSLPSFQHRQIRVLFIALLIIYLGAFDYLTNFGVPYYPLGFIPVAIFSGMVAYAILQYELFKVTPQIAAPTIISTMSDALLVADAEGSIVIANQAAAQLLEKTNDTEKLLGKPIKSYLAQSETLWKQALKAPKGTPELFSGEESSLCTANKKTVPVSLSIGIIRDTTGSPMGMTAVAHDLTRINRLVQELRSQKKDLETINAKLAKQANELTIRTEEAERLNKLAVGREMKMIELKGRLGELQKKKQA
ncbi:MAG TPA: histidine kinase N-terminal 7TM domain-containing protein [Patescibacteria group bacterium]|nr:histidine kinase N-terminal 7TM domain-containing protein [Patescibacteria group bacterium]